ncbi:alpha/beta hydrolase [Lysinibacillus piscis]|uniref:Carboxylesterase n=1 Tax=Lysinibacillus piscis TaxID=2518931 RepID=A0ABQ5NN96_9BACI|nr:carboxylesterase [Lysinibacillus sp. KH24]GLC89814.1 carboxylesterase [Lysinibacillus sp. KH24]
MKITFPKPFFFQVGPRAVLLLHGFTGSSADVRMLGRFLEKKGYTTLAPHYKGHGVEPENLITTGPEDWWQDVIEAYQQLQQAGYEEIAVAGLSLGGVMALNVALQQPVKGIVTMCAPMTMRTTDIMFEGVMKYAKDFKTFQRKPVEEIEAELQAIQQQGMPSLAALRAFIERTRQEIDMIYSPIFVVQARNDEVIDIESANIIYNETESLEKTIKWYEHSKHVITLDQEKEQLHEDIFHFLEGLNWTK